jgi:uncharacterized Zn finger protein
MNKARQEQVIIALKEKGATQPCPRCKNLEFEVIGEAGIPIAAPRGSFWGGPAPEIPVVLVSCKNCGYISQHAIGMLGLRRS